MYVLGMGNFLISVIHLLPFNGKLVGCFFNMWLNLPLYVV